MSNRTGHLPEPLGPGRLIPGRLAADVSDDNKRLSTGRSGDDGVGARPLRRLILVVEDDPMVRNLTARMLHRLGYRTVLAPDAETALDRLRDTDGITLLMSDVVLPGGMDGVALADACIELRPDLPVALVSGYPKDALERGVNDPGRYALLPKPYTTAQLAEFVEGVLANHH